MKHLLTLLFIVVVSTVHAQFDQLQTQYIFNPVLINPACAGQQGFLSATMTYRRQWVGIEGAPETFSMTLDSPLKSGKHNLGAVLLCDKVGVTRQTAYELLYTYRIRGPRWSFAAGIAPFIHSLRSDWSRVQTVQSDQMFQNSYNEMRFGVAFGIYFDAEHLFAGISGQGVNQENVIIGSRNQPFHLYTGIRLGKKDRPKFVVSTLIRYLDPEFTQFDINANVLLKNALGFGVSYRWNESVAAMVSFRVNQQFMLAYAYDYSVSGLSRYNSGSHEIVLRYDFGYTVKANSPR